MFSLNCFLFEQQTGCVLSVCRMHSKTKEYILQYASKAKLPFYIHFLCAGIIRLNWSSSY